MYGSHVVPSWIIICFIADFNSPRRVQIDMLTLKTRAILLCRDITSTSNSKLEGGKAGLGVPLVSMHFMMSLSNWVDTITYYSLTNIRQLEEIAATGRIGGVAGG